MGSATFGAFHPADTEPEGSGGQLNRPPVVSMNWQTGRMGTGTGQLVKRKVKNNRIIERLRNLIAIFDKNGYHGLVNRHRITCVWAVAGQTFPGWGLLFFYVAMNMITQKTRHKAIWCKIYQNNLCRASFLFDWMWDGLGPDKMRDNKWEKNVGKHWF